MLGTVNNLIGPALTTLQGQVDTSVRSISALFAAQSLGYLVGSLAGGRGYDRSHGKRLFAGALFVIAAALCLVPTISSLVVLCFAFTLLGLGAGAMDVGGNTLLVWERGAAAGPYLNALHLAFGVGALAVPVLINRSLAWRGDLRTACWTLAVLAVVAGLAVLHRDEPEPRRAHADVKRRTRPSRELALVAGFFVFAVGLELGFAGWITTYAETIHLGGANTASALTTVFWAAFTLSRLASIGIARRVSAARMVRGANLLAVAAAALLLIARDAELPVFVATALFGAAVAPQFPMMIAYAEQRITLTGIATSWFVGAAALGAFALPWLIGQLYDGVGARVMPAAVLLAAIATTGWFVLIGRKVPPSSFGRQSVSNVKSTR